ncbi:hypothetical protein JHK87_033603 [Glycine soja]|nr:hypothetical protein JHK87_033603 [Glycine soja]
MMRRKTLYPKWIKSLDNYRPKASSFALSTRRLSIYGVIYKGRDHVSNETITLKEISRGSYPNSNVSDSSSRDASMVGKHGYEPEIGSLKLEDQKISRSGPNLPSRMVNQVSRSRKLLNEYEQI